ncbi:MAG: 5'/3'-nucleotidase SurE [Ectothiorhodospiraceae bacterium]|nr:5'/3'-nucleotidase SurE [Ectothiorhodospiraceae bacterium]MCH8504434.1 5'/3'-nucleotidase SurE [Ectothiorhodospiraceae bacterium]
MNRPVKRVLLTNDDGVEANGLKILERIASAIAEEIWVVAPERDQSGTAHSITLHEPIRVRQLEERRFAVGGTPSDAVIMACHHLMKDNLPELVMSGVNRGANIADAVAYSGTIGAATTALIMGIPAMALSQGFRSGDPVHWETAERYGPELVEALLSAPDRDHVCFNINFPALAPGQVTGTRVTGQGRGSIRGVNLVERTDTRGNPYFWFSFRHDYSDLDQPGTDVDALRQGAVAVSPLRLERDHDGLRQLLAQRLER